MVLLILGLEPAVLAGLAGTVLAIVAVILLRVMREEVTELTPDALEAFEVLIDMGYDEERVTTGVMDALKNGHNTFDEIFEYVIRL